MSMVDAFKITTYYYCFIYIGARCKCRNFFNHSFNALL